MLRGYRLVIFAAFGWFIAASPPTEGATRDQAAGQQADIAEMQRIATALEKLPKAPPPDAGCQSGQDDRRSDLCAQWKAADSAFASAVWTGHTFWLGVVGLFIGGLTLAAAVAAARYARRAAIATEETVGIARDSSKGAIEALAIAARNADAAAKQAEAAQQGATQNRAWVNIIPHWEFMNGTINGTTASNSVYITALINNVGRTPALDVKNSTRIDILDSDEIAPPLVWGSQVQNVGGVLHIGVTQQVPGHPISDEEFLRIAKSGQKVVLTCIVRYRETTKPEEWRESILTARYQFNYRRLENGGLQALAVAMVEDYGNNAN